MQDKFKQCYELLKKYGQDTVIKLATSKNFYQEHKKYNDEKKVSFLDVQKTFSFSNEKMKELYSEHSREDAETAKSYVKELQKYKQISNPSGLFLVAIKEGYGKKIKVVDASPAIESKFTLIDRIDKHEIEVSDEVKRTTEAYKNIPEEYVEEVTRQAKEYLFVVKQIPERFQFQQIVMKKAVDIYQARVQETIEEDKKDVKERRQVLLG